MSGVVVSVQVPRTIVIEINRGQKGDPGGGSSGIGTQGPPGIQGIQGIQGIPGVKGDTGSQGIQGLKGDTGSQGIQGLKGDTGSQGIQGVPGSSGSAGLGLLVYAQQNVELTWPTYSGFTIPFDTEVIDSQNLFSNGFFTPNTTALYRINYQIALAASGSLGFYTVDLNSANGSTSTQIYNFARSESYSGAPIPLFSCADILMTAGLAYSISVYTNGTNPRIPVDPTTKNSLTIERLS